MNMGEAESRNSNFATVGAGSEDWVNAIEFVPGQPYCGRTAPSSAEAPLQGSVTKEDTEKEQSAVETKKQLCPYAAVGECRYGENCVYLHGDACDVRAAGPPSRGCRPEVTTYKILHRGPREGHGALIRGAAQQGHGVWHLHGGGLRESQPQRAPLRDSLQLQPHLLSQVYSQVEEC